MSYIDDDGDPIVLDSNEELLDFLKNYAKDGKSPKLHVNVRDGDQDSFEIITRKEVNVAAGDNASIKSLLPPYSEVCVTALWYDWMNDVAYWAESSLLSDSVVPPITTVDSLTDTVAHLIL